MTDATERRCGTCRWYDVDRVKDKAGRIMKRKTARCLWVLSVPIADAVIDGCRLLHTHYMNPTGGTTCPTWEARND